MSVVPRYANAIRLTAVPAFLVAASLILSAQPDNGGKKLAEPMKTGPAAEAGTDKSSAAPGVRLPDGTFLWTGPASRNGDGQRIVISPEELQKLYDQVDALKKQLAARKPVPPSACTIRSRVEKRGDVLVVASRLNYRFRTAAANTAVALGGRRAFLVSASLDGNKLPILDTGEDGFAALIEAAGDHTLGLEVESAVTVRGTKSELGFELGLPRAAITTLAFTPPANVKRVNLATRTPDPGQSPKPAETRRVPGLDVTHLAARAGQEGYALGPIDQLEVAWEPPAAAPLPDAVQSATIDVTCLLAEGFVETTAKIQPRGPARVWKIAAPADCVLTVDRAALPVPLTEPGMIDSPTVIRPPDPAKPVWMVEFPIGTSASDWIVSALLRVPRAKMGEAKHSGPFAVGPFGVLDVSRQTGTVRVSAAANTWFEFKNGPELRRVEPEAPPEDEAVALFRLATGPTGSTPSRSPLLEFEARPLAGTVQVRPTYRFTLTESGWRVRAELRIVPIRTSINNVTIELPSDWRGSGVTPPELVEGVQQTKGDGPVQILAVGLAGYQKQPFDLVLTATLPFGLSDHEGTVDLPRFPEAGERDTTVSVAVPEGFEVHGSAFEWDGGQPARRGRTLSPAPAAEGKPARATTALSGRFEHGLARVELAWSPYRAELLADLRTEILIQDGQVRVVEQVRLRAPEGFSRAVRFRPLAEARGLKVSPPLDVGESGWAVSLAPDAKEATVRFEYAIPRAPHAGAAWQQPVGLIWPQGATRTESVVQVWTRSPAAIVSGAGSGPWRVMPPESVAGRDSLPALTLAGFGDDLPLALDLAEASGSTAATVWIDRGLIQAWLDEDGIAGCRARFLLSRWLSDTIEVALPESLAGPGPEVLIDGRKVGPDGGIAVPDRRVRVRLPEPQPGRTVMLELRYHLAPEYAQTGPVLAPAWPKAAVMGPVRWQVTVPPGRVPLILGGGRVEQRWGINSALPVPGSVSSDALERWFATGVEPGGKAGPMETAVLRLGGADSIRVFDVSRLGLVVVSSLVLLVTGLLLWRMSAVASGLSAALLGGAVAVCGILFPQPSGVVAAAAIPGLAVLIAVLGTTAAVRWFYRRRITHLSGFSRGRPEPVATAGTTSIPSSRRGIPLPAGSTGPHEDAYPSGTRSVASSVNR